jgi:hypothetical protein
MSTAWISGVAGLSIVMASGCGPLRVEGYRVHSARAVPGTSALETYPHVTYEDRDAYLLGSEWYYRDRSYGWVVFDEEPPELRAYRERTFALGSKFTR